ncbi:MAG TPA: prepilin-type N-terminal cleavage/methylation domain-containing protein [Fimbriimonas sp.]|nr:prepilin-type N-terminal cleavage/methylation domain-containing protein [Fimbriimonas sp.]
MRRIARKRGQGGFTLVEISVVLVVLVLFASMIIPNVITMQKGYSRQSTYGALLDFAREARLNAINQKTTYALTYDSAQTQVVMKKEPPQDMTTNANNIATPVNRPLASVQSSADLQQVKTMDLANPIKLDSFRVGNNTVDAGSWVIHFYADGSSDGGGAEIDENGLMQSLLIDKNGIPSIAAGQLPQTTDQVWQAGTYAQKV